MYRKKSVPWSGKQPQFNARIDTNNPITRGLVFAYNPATGTGFAVINGLLKSATTIGSTNIANSIAGRGTVFSGNTANRIVFASPISSGDMTLVVVATPSAASSGQAFFGLFNSADVNASSNYLSIESGPVYGALSTDNSNWVAASGRAPVANEIVTLGASFTASGKRDLYINGAFSASSATARNPTGLDVVSVGCYNGGSASGWLSPLTGRVFVSLVFNRVLSASEHKALSENPWQVFKPLPGYFPVAAGSTPKTATANIAAAIQAPRSANASVAAAIRVSNTSTASLSAAIAQRNTATASVSAVIKAGVTANASVNAAIQAPRSATASLSAAVRAGQSATASLSAAVRLAAAATASLSAAVRAGQTATASISGAVQVSATATASLSASITAPGALSITASLSAAVRQANAATASIDSAIRAARTASASIDSAITAQRTASASASAAVSVAFSVSASLDSAVQRVAIASASLSAYVQADTTITQAEVDMLADIWRRLGLDIANPLVQGTTTLTFGPTITLSGSGTITSTRTGSTDSGPAAGVMLLDVWQRLGLDPANPMTASDTAINAGAVSQTVSESAGTVTVQRA